jgi:WD40 repeat protein
MVHSGPVLSMNFSLDNRLLASGDKTGAIKVWKVADGKCLRQISI